MTMPEAKRDEVPLPEKVVVDRHLPTGVVIYAYTADQLREYGRQCAQAERKRWEKRAELLTMERDMARSRFDFYVKLLTGIHALLSPPHIHHEGRALQFNNPDDANAVLQALSNRIRALPDEIAAVTRSQNLIKDTP